MDKKVKRWHNGKRVLHDQRPWVSLGYHPLFGRSSIRIQCPFCYTVTRAYIWSLAGSDKRCDGCNALFCFIWNGLPWNGLPNL